MSDHEQFPLEGDVTKPEWGENMQSFLERVFIKRAIENKPINIEFNGAKLTVENQSPDEVETELNRLLSE